MNSISNEDKLAKLIDENEKLQIEINDVKSDNGEMMKMFIDFIADIKSKDAKIAEQESTIKLMRATLEEVGNMLLADIEWLQEELGTM